ncbi:MAG: hypothetical protein ACF8NJ_03085 [Phycisphaerales bacterium JB038]
MTTAPEPDPIVRAPAPAAASKTDQTQVWDVTTCIDCGYNLAGNESGVCPECGHALEPGRFDPQPFLRRANIHLGSLAAVVLLAHLLAAFVFTRPGGFPAILGFSLTYGLGVGLAVFLVAAASIAMERRHRRLRVRCLFYCTAGWYFWPLAALPLAVVIGVVAGNFTVSLVSLFTLCALGVAWYIARWRRLCAQMPLPLDAVGPMLQLLAYLVSSILLPTGLLLFALTRLRLG